MAYFAGIDDTGLVLEVQVLADEDCGGGIFPESEPIGQAYQASLGLTGEWLQCSPTGAYRGAYPGMGWIYDAALDEFIFPPQPHKETP
jgi:hypothetical protein